MYSIAVRAVTIYKQSTSKLYDYMFKTEMIIYEYEKSHVGVVLVLQQTNESKS